MIPVIMRVFYGPSTALHNAKSTVPHAPPVLPRQVCVKSARKLLYREEKSTIDYCFYSTFHDGMKTAFSMLPIAKQKQEI